MSSPQILAGEVCEKWIVIYSKLLETNYFSKNHVLFMLFTLFTKNRVSKKNTMSAKTLVFSVFQDAFGYNRLKLMAELKSYFERQRLNKLCEIGRHSIIISLPK